MRSYPLQMNHPNQPDELDASDDADDAVEESEDAPAETSSKPCTMAPNGTTMLVLQF